MKVAHEFMELLGRLMVSVAVGLQASGLLGLFKKIFLITSTFVSTLASCWVGMLETAQ